MTIKSTSAAKPLTPPDLKWCQAEKPGNGPFTMGGTIGNPLNGYRVRCDAKPTCIVTESRPGADGRVGSMALCDACRFVMEEMMPGHCTTKPIRSIKTRRSR